MILRPLICGESAVCLSGIGASRGEKQGCVQVFSHASGANNPQARITLTDAAIMSRKYFFQKAEGLFGNVVLRYRISGLSYAGRLGKSFSYFPPAAAAGKGDFHLLQ
jgi:hypothetical protein